MPDSPRPIGSNSKRRDPIVFDNKNPIFACDDDPIRTALDRATESVFGSIAPAVRAACNVVQPDATPRNPMQPNHDMRKTKPIPPRRASRLQTSTSSVESSQAPLRATPRSRGTPKPRKRRLPRATPRNRMQPHATPRNQITPGAERTHFRLTRVSARASSQLRGFW